MLDSVIVGVDEVVAEDDLAVAGVVDPDAHVPAPDRFEALEGVLDPAACFDQFAVQGFEAFHRHRCEQAFDVAEVVSGCGVRYAGSACDFSQAETADPVLDDDLDRCRTQDVGEIAVMVGGLCRG